MSSVTFNTKLYVTTISNNFQPLTLFCHKEHHLRCCIGLELNIGLFQKNPNRGLGSWNFQEYWRTCGNFRSQLKKKRNFQGWSRKNHVEFPWVLIFDLGISKGCHTVLQNYQGWKLVFSGISKVKVTNLKIPEFLFKKVYLQPPPRLDFFWNSPL